MHPIIYVAGPYRAATHDLIAANIARARSVAVLAAHLGWSPLCPHTNSAHMEEDLEDKGDEFWLAATRVLMERCDAVVLVDGWKNSAGTLAELARARSKGLPIFMSPDLLITAREFVSGSVISRDPDEFDYRTSLQSWFGLSYSSFATLPRVLMEAMPEQWQRRIAVLLHEYDDAYPNQPEIGTRVQATKNGRITKFPTWVKNYRHPDRAAIDGLRGFVGGEP